VLIAGLHVGREVLAPLALALLLTIAALPMVAWLERGHIPRIPSVMLVVLALLGLIASLLYVVVTQALALAESLPSHETLLREKLISLGQGSGPIDGVTRLIQRLGNAVAPGDGPVQGTVVIASASAGPLAGLFGLAVLVLAPAATFAITLLLMVFILVAREDIRDRVLRLAGLHELHRTTAAMADATGRLGKFLLMQLLVNGCFGAAMGLGLWLLGVPNAPLWGVLGFALRFVPFIGAPLSLLFPLLIAFATTEGWYIVLAVLALFAVVAVVVAYVLEPWLFGVSTGVTPLALILGSAFWAILWGPIGLILAPAITGCLVILGRHIPALGFLDVALGDGAPLPAPTRFYQRLLAGDADGASRVLLTQVDRAGTMVAIEQLVMPAIIRISSDRPAEDFRPAMAIRGARTLLRVLEGSTEANTERADVVVLPVGGALDHAAVAAVVVALQEAGISATTAAHETALLSVLVAAGEAPRHRLLRALREAHALADTVLVFAATDEAAQGFTQARAHLGGWTEDLPSLMAGTALALQAATAEAA